MNTDQNVSPFVGYSRKNAVDLDLTGSPLKDECEIDLIDSSWAFGNNLKMWLIAEEKYLPISLKNARKILNTINFNPLTLKIKTIECSIWILTDDINVPLIGVHVVADWNSSQIVHYHVSIFICFFNSCILI